MNRDYEPLIHSEDLKRVCRELITFLYGEDSLVYRVGEALGLVCKGQGQKQGQRSYGGKHVKNILRRLFWHLNDESGAYCRGAPVAIGEIGRNSQNYVAWALGELGAEETKKNLESLSQDENVIQIVRETSKIWLLRT